MPLAHKDFHLEFEDFKSNYALPDILDCFGQLKAKIIDIRIKKLISFSSETLDSPAEIKNEIMPPRYWSEDGNVTFELDAF